MRQRVRRPSFSAAIVRSSRAGRVSGVFASSTRAPTLCGPWDWSRGLREPDGWDDHARFMDALVEEGFILLGGPLQDDRQVLHIVTAPSEQAIRDRLAQDPWSSTAMLSITSIEEWTILLDGRH